MPHNRESLTGPEPSPWSALHDQSGWMMSIMHALGRLESGLQESQRSSDCRMAIMERMDTRLRHVETVVHSRFDKMEERIATMETKPPAEPPSAPPETKSFWREMSPREWMIWFVLIGASTGLVKIELVQTMLGTLK